MDELADWDDFFDSFSTSLRRALLAKFGFEAKTSVEAAFATLSAEALDKLEHFRADVIALSAPDSKALQSVIDGVRDLEMAALDRPNDLAGWLYLHKPALFDSAVELLQFDRGMNKPAMWTGFQIDAAFKNASLDPKNMTFLGELSASFSSKIVKAPLVRVLPFQRVSGRSDSRALMLTISVEGAPQSHRVFKKHGGGKRPVTEYFTPERGAAVSIDDKARTIDIVSADLGAVLRKTIVKVVLKHLGIPDSRIVRLQPRWVMVESLASRRPLPVDPTQDGILKVRFVGARMSRGSGGVVTLDARDADAKDAWDAWASWGKSKPGSFGVVDMLGATMEFTFPDPSSPSGERIRSLRLNKPFGLTMQYWPKAHQEDAIRLLERLKLLKTEPLTQ